jgi:hypothetical protein
MAVARLGQQAGGEMLWQDGKIQLEAKTHSLNAYALIEAATFAFSSASVPFPPPVPAAPTCMLPFFLFWRTTSCSTIFFSRLSRALSAAS